MCWRTSSSDELAKGGHKLNTGEVGVQIKVNSSSSKTYEEACVNLYDHWLAGVSCPDMKGPRKVNSRMIEGRCWCCLVTRQHSNLIAERPGISSLAG